MKYIISTVFVLMCFSCIQKREEKPSEFQLSDITSSNRVGDTLLKTRDIIVIQGFNSVDTFNRFNPIIDSAKYAVDKDYFGSPAKLDFSNYQLGKKFITVITEGVKKQGVNFAGHFCFISWGCGSPCHLSAIVDFRDGKVYEGPEAPHGYSFSKKSKLILINPPDSLGWYQKNVDWLKPEICIWESQKIEWLKSNS